MSNPTLDTVCPSLFLLVCFRAIFLTAYAFLTRTIFYCGGGGGVAIMRGGGTNAGMFRGNPTVTQFGAVLWGQC